MKFLLTVSIWGRRGSAETTLREEGGREELFLVLPLRPGFFFQKESLCPSSSDPPPFTLRKWADRRDLARNQTRKSNFTFLGGLVVSEIPFQEGPRRTPQKLGAEREWRERERRGRNRISIPIPVASANPSDEKKPPSSSPPPAVKLFRKGGGRSQLAG